MSSVPGAVAVAHGSARPFPRRRGLFIESAHGRRAGQGLAAAVLVAVCAATALWSGPADPWSARVDVARQGAAWICLEHQRVKLAAGPDGFASIEPGRRVTIGLDLPAAAGAGQCVASASFVPQAGRAYLTDFETAGDQCTLAVYRQVSSNRLGRGFEPSSRPAGECS